jgi:hypothetical protein
MVPILDTANTLTPDAGQQPRVFATASRDCDSAADLSWRSAVDGDQPAHLLADLPWRRP